MDKEVTEGVCEKEVVGYRSVFTLTADYLSCRECIKTQWLKSLPVHVGAHISLYFQVAAS